MRVYEGFKYWVTGLQGYRATWLQGSIQVTGLSGYVFMRVPALASLSNSYIPQRSAL